MRLVRVLVASDLLLFREGLHRLLGDMADVDPVGAVAVAGVAERLRADEVDVVVLALSSGRRAGAQLAAVAALLHAEDRSTGLVVVSSDGDGLVRPLLESGPRGVAFLLDEHVTDVDVLARALRDVADGMVSLDADAAEALIGRGQPGLAELTARERDVLAHLARGLSNQAIAAALQLTVKTVEANVSSIFRKLGLDVELGQDRRVTAALLYLDGRV